MGLVPKYRVEAEKLQKRARKLAKKRDINTRVVHVSFLIVCEGEKTEPLYFQALVTNKTSEIRDVQIEGCGRSTVSLVKQAITIRDNSDKEFDRVWVVFDKDDFNDFNAAIKLAEKHNILCAWTNEAFELWYYLHFQFLDTGITRDQYIKKLERELKNRLNDSSFKYVKKNPDIYSLLQKYGEESCAIRYAQRLRKSYNSKDYASHKPCTTVDLLVEELKYPERLSGVL